MFGPTASPVTLASLMRAQDGMNTMIAWVIAIVVAAFEYPIPLGFP